MKILPVSNMKYNSSAKLSVSNNKQMTNSLNSQRYNELPIVSFEGGISTSQTSACLNKAKKLFLTDDKVSAIKLVTQGMSLLFPVLAVNSISSSDLNSTFLSKYNNSLASVKDAFKNLDDKDKNNQAAKKEFMDVMFIHPMNEKNINSNRVDDTVLEIFSEMDNKVYGKYKSNLVKSAVAQGMFYRNLEDVLASTKMSNDDKSLLRVKNDKNFDDIIHKQKAKKWNWLKELGQNIMDVLTYQSDEDDPYIPQDPRYTP